MTPSAPDTAALADLRAKAEAATPGPWEVCYHLKSVIDDASCPCGYRGVIYGPEHDIPMALFQPGHDREPEGQEGLGPMRYERAKEISNSLYIAAANPATILSLIDTITDLRQALAASAAREERMRVALEPFAKFAEIADRDGQMWTDQSSIAEVMDSALRHTVSYGHLRNARTALSQEAET